MRLDLVRLGSGVRGGSLTRLVPALVPCLSVFVLSITLLFSLLLDPCPQQLKGLACLSIPFPCNVHRELVVHKLQKEKRRNHPVHDTYLLSRFPAPNLQNPRAQIPITAPKIAIPPGPRVGKLRLYLIVSYPPAGGISLLVSLSPCLTSLFDH